MLKDDPFHSGDRAVHRCVNNFICKREFYEVN